MNAIQKLTSGPGYQKFITMMYGLGASIVIIGALFKIQHYPGASLMLMIGMGTEAIIFFFSAFEKPHVEPDWSLVFPQFSEQYHGVKSDKSVDLGSLAGGISNQQTHIQQVSSSASAELDGLLKKANIDEKLLASLGEGFRNLNNTVSSLNDITAIGDKSKALGDSLVKAGRTTEDYNMNLASVNASYDKIAKKLSEQANANSEAQQSLNKAMEQFVATLEATSKTNTQFQQESAKLVKSIAELNQVYANMLNAFNVNNKK